MSLLLPTRLGHAGDQAFMGHLTQADAADAEPTKHASRAPAYVAAGIGAHLVLGLTARFFDQCLFCQILLRWSLGTFVPAAARKKAAPRIVRTNVRPPRAPSCGSR